MIRKILCIIIAFLLAGVLFACQARREIGETGVLDLQEVKQSESLYGKDRETVFRVFQITDKDVISESNLDDYYTLIKTRTVGGLSFLHRLAFNLPSEYCGQDLEYFGEPGSPDNEDILKAIKSIYKDMIGKYGQPDNDSDVIRPHLADWIDNNPVIISRSNDTWQLENKTILTMSVGVIGDRTHILLSYRQKYN